MHLVKVAIEKHHNGEVFVESEEGVGSKFGFRLPTDVKPEEEEQQPSGHNENNNSDNNDTDWEISIEKA